MKVGIFKMRSMLSMTIFGILTKRRRMEYSVCVYIYIYDFFSFMFVLVWLIISLLSKFWVHLDLPKVSIGMFQQNRCLFILLWFWIVMKYYIWWDTSSPRSYPKPVFCEWFEAEEQRSGYYQMGFLRIALHQMNRSMDNYPLVQSSHRTTCLKDFLWMHLQEVLVSSIRLMPFLFNWLTSLLKMKN